MTNEEDRGRRRVTKRQGQDQDQDQGKMKVEKKKKDWEITRKTNIKRTTTRRDGKSD